MAVASEAGELLAEFRWLTPEQAASVMDDSENGQAVKDEIADVAIFLLRLTQVLGVDLEAAIRDKLARNATRFPTPLPD
jgi:NTP pyrophosphatase (non-canonical NTP hydrolase)